MRILGVDPGGRGALALLEGDKIIELADMPVNYVRRGKTDKAELDVWSLSELLAVWQADVAYFEQVGGHPGDAPASAFSFGRIAGACEALVRTCDAQFHFVPPATWKSKMKLTGSGKDGSVVMATNLFPARALEFREPKIQGEGRAEAALIAEYGRRVETGLLPR